MEPFFVLMLSLFILFVIIMIMRLVGAWMLRINEVIFYQKQILDQLKKLNENLNKKL